MVKRRLKDLNKQEPPSNKPTLRKIDEETSDDATPRATKSAPMRGAKRIRSTRIAPGRFQQAELV